MGCDEPKFIAVAVAGYHAVECRDLFLRDEGGTVGVIEVILRGVA
jgi:hypothetical protein